MVTDRALLAILENFQGRRSGRAPALRRPGRDRRRPVTIGTPGGVPERSNGLVLKTSGRASAPWVRIPPPPSRCRPGRGRRLDKPRVMLIPTRRIASFDQWVGLGVRWTGPRSRSNWSRRSKRPNALPRSIAFADRLLRRTSASSSRFTARRACSSLPPKNSLATFTFRMGCEGSNSIRRLAPEPSMRRASSLDPLQLQVGNPPCELPGADRRVVDGIDEDSIPASESAYRKLLRPAT